VKVEGKTDDELRKIISDKIGQKKIDDPESVEESKKK
ncbi:sec-independent translocation protein mttA-Hcf106, partial [Marine Group I thaumarchaeote SCGC AAA799-N04]